MRGNFLMTATEMTYALKSHARAAGKKTVFSIRPFHSGGITRALRGYIYFFHHGAGFLEEAQCWMEAHDNHRSNVLKYGRKRKGPWSSTDRSTNSR